MTRVYYYYRASSPRAASRFANDLGLTMTSPFYLGTILRLTMGLGKVDVSLRHCIPYPNKDRPHTTCKTKAEFERVVALARL